MAYLVQVFRLDLVSCLTHPAWLLRVRKHQLVHYDVMSVYLTFRQLLDQSLGLIQGQELGNTNADEGRLLLYGEM